MTLDGLTQKVTDLEEDGKEMHKRIRETLADLKIEIDRIGAEQRTTATGLATLKELPIDATKLVLSTKSILALCLAAITIVASYWNLSAKMDNQHRDDLAAAAVTTVQISSLKDVATDAKSTAADAKRQYELLRYDLQAFKDAVNGQNQKGKK